jgi:hypothetical protein
VNVHDKPLQKEMGSAGMLCIGDGFAQGKHVEYTEYGVPYGGHSIEVATVADSSLRSENIVGCIRTHVPTDRLVLLESTN